MPGVLNPVPRAPRELPGSIEEAPSTFEPDVRRLLREQVHATLQRMVDELVGEEGREGAVRVLSSVESYAAAMRGVLADLSEPTSPRRRHRGYGGGLDDVGMEIPMPNQGFGGPPGTGDGFLGDLVETAKDVLGKQLEANRDGQVEHKLQTLTATAARLQGIKPGPMREQLQAMLDSRMAELQASLGEEDGDPSAPLALPGGTVIETGTLLGVETLATGAPARPEPCAVNVEVTVMGETQTVPALSTWTLGEFRAAVLQEMGHTGRPPEDFEIRTAEGALLYPALYVGLLPHPSLYLNLAVGAGGADEAPPAHDHFPDFTRPTFPASAPTDDF